MNCFNPDKPDATFPFLEADMGRRPEASLVDAALSPLPEFKARDEWILVQRVSGVPSPVVGLLNDAGDYFNAGEPFFVSGANTFQIQASSGQFLVTRSARRELLSWSNFAGEGLSNSPGQSFPYSSTFAAPAVGVNTNWVYLDANLAWQVAPIGSTPNGMPFGWGAPSASRAGRYYNLEFATQDNGNGLTQVHFVCASSPVGLATSGVGYAVSANQAALHGICAVGDDAFASVGSSAPAGIGFQSTMKSSRLWTVAITVAVAGATGPGGFLSVIRRGY